MIKRLIVGAVVLAQGVFLWGQQPVTTRLEYHPALQKNLNRLVPKCAVQVDTVDLPFVDDFSYYAASPRPDPSLWMDRYVFINNDYPEQPPSNGVATFDALDADGKIYTTSASVFYADTLTSRPVNLGGSGIQDVYLSFFFQPQGFGDSPEEGDSLILQFKSPVTRQWHSVWNTPGTAARSFKQVMIAVPPSYYHKGFQFRFMNIASLDQDDFNAGTRSNADHWHIDYIRLDKGRNENDITMKDVAVIAPLKSQIKGYRSIPWNQFQVAYTTRLDPRISITYRNNDRQGYFVTRLFEITDVYHSTTVPIEQGGGENIRAGEIFTFNQDILNPFISPSVDSALFELKGYLKTVDGDRKENDTVRFYQEFKNFFARDDGIPESGYGYRGINAQGCAVACRYETFMPDSLQAVNLYFNPTANNVTSQYLFHIAVWKDDNGRPGEQVYLSPQEYSPDVTGKFVSYVLENPIYITKNYWIGWQQVTSGFLNAGFDRNYNDKGNLWYNSSGTWQQDVNDGTLMIRPVVGKRADIATSAPATGIPGKKAAITIYPNPASQYIRVAVENTPDYDMEIYGQTGRLRYRGTVNVAADIDVSRFEPGLYIIRLIHRKTGYVQTQKLLIIR
jgi:hypothetical protein